MCEIKKYHGYILQDLAGHDNRREPRVMRKNKKVKRPMRTAEMRGFVGRALRLVVYAPSVAFDSRTTSAFRLITRLNMQLAEDENVNDNVNVKRVLTPISPSPPSRAVSIQPRFRCIAFLFKGRYLMTSSCLRSTNPGTPSISGPK